MSTILLSTSYLPSISYISAILEHDNVLIEQNENYTKKTLRNRCRIYAANGVINLSLPVLKSANPKQLVKDVKINYSDNWQKQHFKSIESAYKSSPFYLYLIDDYIKFFTRQYKFLLDFNLEILQTILNFLEFKPNIEFTKHYAHNSHKCKDARYLSNLNGLNNTNNKEYYQVFANKHGFKNNLSIIDLLFNIGNEAYSYLL